MVGPAYLLNRPGPPSAPRRFFNRQVLPAAIDAAGGLEAVLEGIACRARRQPLAVLGAVFGLGFLLGCIRRR